MADVFLGPAGDDPEAVDVKRLAVRPGDCLVLKLDYEPGEVEVAELRERVTALLGADVRVMVLGPGVEIGAIGPEGPEAAGLVKQAALSVLPESGFDPHNARAVLGMGPAGS